MRISVYRKAHFNAAHRLFNPKWSEEKNFEVFGPCSNPLYHGHNYELEVRVTGEVNEETGFVIDLNILKNLIEDRVERYMDHKNLNLEVPEFKSLIPTAENICYVIWSRLRTALPEKYLLSVKLFETPRNFVEYPAVE